MKTGELIVLSTEQYSDYDFTGPYRVLKDFEWPDVVVAAKESFVPAGPKNWQQKAGPDDVTEYLEKDGFIEKVPCSKFHLGSYGDIDITEEDWK